MVTEYVPEYKLHIERDAYSGAHFDSTVVPLTEGLVLFNGHRVSRDNYPKIFEKWTDRTSELTTPMPIFGNFYG